MMTIGIFLFFGCSFVVVGLIGLFLARKVQQWPSTVGIIDKIESKRVKVAKGGTGFRLLCDYHYQVGSSCYSGNRIYMWDGTETSKSAKLLVQRFPLGHEVAVFFNPRNPEKACLIPHDSKTPMGFLVVGLFCLLVSLSILVFELF